ncbi:MAG TPA: hypothetical protein VMH49_02105, partial [Thermoplasmata archaeon]|nr:hypothetical protein [Thermoplasmata archaeon]
MVRPMRSRRAWPSALTAVLAVAVALLLLPSPSPVRGAPGLSRTETAAATPFADAVGAGAAGPVATGSGAPSSWAGTTEATLFPGYNASIPANFRSLVDDWQVGQPTVVPTTGVAWFPTRAVSVAGSPLPTFAPALRFNVSNDSFAGIDRAVSNTSAFAFDPVTGLLYATVPANDTVVAVNVSSGLPTGTVYPVGSDPTAILYDTVTQDLFVADEGSNAVTVINPHESGAFAIVWA